MPHRTCVLDLLTLSALASGVAALMLQLQWGRQLALAFGGSHNAVAAVLTAFMLGLGIGSWLGGRRADRLRHPALAIVWIEVGLAVVGPALGLVLIGLPVAAARLLPGADSSTDPLFLGSRLVLALTVLMVPTALMGATYPILVRAGSRGIGGFHRGIGRLYAAGTIGGVIGVLAAGFAILPRWGTVGTLTIAAAANLVAAAAAFAAHRIGTADLATSGTDRPKDSDALPLALLLASMCSGAVVLGAETLWHRALKMVIANSTASLSLLLALTLAGLGVGAVVGSPLLRRARPLVNWARLQIAAILLIVIQATTLPEIALLIRVIRPDEGWARVLLPALVVGGVVILPAALLFGAAWPLLLAAASPRVCDGGRRIGKMGIANSFGAAAGSTAVGMMVLPAAGFGRSMLVVAAASAVMVLIALATSTGTPPRSQRRSRILAGSLAVALAISVTAAPPFGRIMIPSLALEDTSRTVLTYHETTAGTVLVTERTDTGERAMYVDNNAVIGSSYDALKVARMLGLAPTLLHPNPTRVLVIGFGAGVTTATVAGSPDVEHIDVIEIVPGVVSASKHFSTLNHDVIGDPRVQLSTNDGRNHLLLNPGPWDLITCDPVHPLYGSAALYSLDFFELARGRLSPGGIVCQYLPLHRMPTEAFRRAIATFQSAFPESWVLFGLGHAMLVGSDGPLDLDWERWAQRLARHELREDLAATALHHPAQIAALLQLDPAGCAAVSAGEPATDLHPRLEFLAPAAYEPGLWPINAKLLVEAYTSPIGRIKNLPPGMDAQLQRLVAGKRLLLFSLLERTGGNLDAARTWLARAVQVAGDDPEIKLYARQFAFETQH